MISFFIPIRKGSKRILNKNTVPINKYKLGLTEIKVLQLQKLRKICLRSSNKFLSNIDFNISTDCKKVKKYIKKFKWIKLHHRKKSLAGDDCLDKLILEVPKICRGHFILWTHVTSPLFNENDYMSFIKKFFSFYKAKKINSAFSADVINKFIIDEKFNWISHDFKKKKWPRTQDLKKFYSVNSAAFLSSRKNYIGIGDRLGKKPLPIISRQNSGFDVDNKDDFVTLKKMIKNKK